MRGTRRSRKNKSPQSRQPKLYYYAPVIDDAGNSREFEVYSTGNGFTIWNDKGYKHVAGPSRRLDQEDIRQEIIHVFKVRSVRLETPMARELHRQSGKQL
jgi:hypothetical protein